MIKFSLACQDGHAFDAWFQSGATYETQAVQGQIACPTCGRTEVGKAIMAPAVATRALRTQDAPRQPDAGPGLPMEQLQQHLRRIRDTVHAKAEYVGGRFAEEARRIHFDESPARGIYGEASADEARSLAEDGIPFLPVPRLPEDMN